MKTLIVGATSPDSQRSLQTADQFGREVPLRHRYGVTQI